MNFIILHGTLGSPDGNWFPWLAKELESLAQKTARPVLPTPEGQDPENWVRVIKETVESFDGPSEEIVFVAHSMSCLAACLYLSQIDNPIKAAFFVSGFAEKYDWPDPYTDLNSSFVEKELNWDKVKNNCSKVFCFDGDNDKYVSLEMAKNFARLCGGKLELVPGGGHLSEGSGYTSFPLLLERIHKELGI